MKTSLNVQNRTQYTNHQMNNAVTNQIYPKKSQYISLDRIFDMMYETKGSLPPGLVQPLSHEQISKTINISWRLLSLLITADQNFESQLEQCNTISLSRHEQVCLSRQRFERYFSHHRETSPSVTTTNASHRYPR